MPSAIASTWRTHSASILSWAIIATSFLVGYVGMLRTKPIYTPDSSFYLAKSLWFAGMSREEARVATAEFAAAYTDKSVAQLAQLFDWGLVQPRVVLSALAAPFVAVLGPIGLAVTTCLLTIALTIVLSILLMRRYGNLAAVSAMLLVNTSAYIMWFNGAMLTESLSALLATMMLAAGWAYVRRPRRWLLIALGALTIVAAFTRQATLIPAGAFVVAWLLGMLVTRSWRSPWVWPAVTVGAASIVTQVLQMLVFAPFSQIDQFVSQTGADDLLGALLASPGLALTIMRSEFRTFIADDPALLVLIIIAVVGVVIFWRRSESHLLVGALLGLALYNITNGTATAFRYAIPGLPFFVASAAVVLAATARTMGNTSAGEDSRFPPADVSEPQPQR